jgi:hypothetical protein
MAGTPTNYSLHNAGGNPNVWIGKLLALLRPTPSKSEWQKWKGCQYNLKFPNDAGHSFCDDDPHSIKRVLASWIADCKKRLLGFSCSTSTFFIGVPKSFHQSKEPRQHKKRSFGIVEMLKKREQLNLKDQEHHHHQRRPDDRWSQEGEVLVLPN